MHRIHKWRPTRVELAAKHDIEAFLDKHAVFLRRDGENERSTCGKLFVCLFVIYLFKQVEVYVVSHLFEEIKKSSCFSFCCYCFFKSRRIHHSRERQFSY